MIDRAIFGLRERVQSFRERSRSSRGAPPRGREARMSVTITLEPADVLNLLDAEPDVEFSQAVERALRTHLAVGAARPVDNP